ncbi:MAG: S1C family serine protease [Janthinobacterium lividum]
MNKVSSYAAVFVVGVASCAVGLKTFGDPASLLAGNTPSKQAVLTALDTTPPALKHFTGDTVVSDAAAKVDAAVVTVHTIGKPVAQSGGDPIFRMFGGGGGSVQPQTPMGAGSGIIISSDGYILTNNHVVADTSKLTVNVGDKGGGEGKAYDAHVVGADPVTDIAVVKIDTAGLKLPVAQLGNSDDVRIGDWAIAVGNPLDVGTTVTLGIISALNRTGQSAEGQAILPAIQTDAAINPGNSGGALANINGQVIGINEAILSPSGTYSGIGFAIPINRAKQIAAELIRNGRASHPYLGVSYQPVSTLSPDDRAQTGIPADLSQGVFVRHVYPGSPAAQAGLHIYDVITQANGQPIADTDALNNLIQGLKVGTTLTLHVLRDGTTRNVNVTLRERPATFGQIQPGDQQQQQPQMIPSPFGP